MLPFQASPWTTLCAPLLSNTYYKIIVIILVHVHYNLLQWKCAINILQKVPVHYRLLRRTHHRPILRVIEYRRERGIYRQLSYAQALKKTGCQSVEATIPQRRLLFAGVMARQPAGRLPKRLMDGKLVGGENPGKGRPEQNWIDCLKDDFEAFGATDGSTVGNRLTFGVDRAVWTLATKMDDGAPWHKGMLQGAEKFMTSWHKEGEEASRRRATKRDFFHICR